jgi:DMSO/TMAO reductase YedYZ molybdopterin-dependent catalytic subunit
MVRKIQLVEISMRNFWANLGLSLLVTLPLAGLLYLAYGVANVSYPPFDFMKLLIERLPGGLITFGIDTMTDLILAIDPNVDLDSAAKTAERLIAVAQFVGLASVIGAIYGLIVAQLHQRGQFFSSEWSSGLVLGLVVGTLLAAVSLTYDVASTASPAFSTTWILVAFLAWGGAHTWLYRRLLAPQEAPSVPVVDAPVIAKTTANEVILLDRRRFLIRAGAGSAVITVVGAGLGEYLRSGETIQGGNIQIAGLNQGLVPAPGTRPEYTPLANHYRIDINVGDPPNVDSTSYRLKITGLVEADLEVSLADIQAYPPVDQFVTLSCISNRIAGRLISTTQWTGVPMKTLLAEWGVKPEATHIKITSFDGFDEIVDIATIMADERVMLTYNWDGIALLPKHGFPLRIYIPDHYGMKQPKWIEQMEFTDAWEEGYWVRRGWSRDAFVKTTSVIDTVAVDDLVEQDGQRLIPIGGIAYAGAKGISGVEVQIDGGEWLPAQLRSPLSDTTWVIWRLDWPFQEGEHSFTVRTYEADGTPQIEQRASQRPDGATGYHSLEAG